MREDVYTKFSSVVKRLRGKKVSPELEVEFLNWLPKHNMVIQLLIASGTLIILDPSNSDGDKIRMNKIILQIPVRELYNDNMLSEDPLVGFKGV